MFDRDQVKDFDEIIAHADACGINAGWTNPCIEECFNAAERFNLREHRNGIYTGMFLDGKLEAHLKEIGEAAEEMFDRLVEQMKKAEGVTEHLKAENQMEWVGRMNSIRSRAEEIVLNDLIYN